MKTSQLWLACCVAGAVWGQVITTEVGGDWPSVGLSQAAVSTPLGQIFANASDKNGNIYIADYDNNQVLRVTPAGIITVVAGNGFLGFSGDGGLAVNASLKIPQGVAVGPDGSVYISDSGNDRVRKVTPDGNITTIAGTGVESFSGDGGPAVNATVFSPRGLIFDQAGNLYIADTRHSRIRMITPAGIISTIAGNGQETYTGEGTATSSALNDPIGLAFDAAGNLYIADTFNHRIRTVSRQGVIATFVGAGVPGFADGTGTGAIFSYPKGIAFDNAGNLIVADPGNNLIRKVSPSRVVTTIAGNGALAFAGDGGNALSASFAGASSVAVDAAGKIYVADTANGRIRVINNSNIVSTFAGNGAFRFSPDGLPALNSFLSDPQDVKIGPDGLLYIVDSQNQRIARVNADKTVVTVAGNHRYGFSGDGQIATSATLYFPRQMAFDKAGNYYIADSLNCRVRKVTPQGIISTLAGTGIAGYTGDNGRATNAMLNYPTGVAADSAGNVYIADQLNNVIRVVTPAGIISTFAGNGQFAYTGDNIPAKSASLAQPERLAIDAQDTLFIADIYNHRIRKVTKDGIIHLVAGTGDVGYSGDGGPATQAKLYSPAGVAVDTAGNVYIADSGNNAIRLVNSSGNITTIAGMGPAGYSGDGGAATSATLNAPRSMAPDGSGGLHIADTSNNHIRRILPAAPAYQVAPTSLSFTATADGALSAAQNIGISSTVVGLGFSISTSAPWLGASQITGSMPASIEITVDPTGLAAGPYSGTITVTAPQALVPVMTVNVSVTITPGVPPTLAASSSKVDLAFVTGASPASSTLNLMNQGGGSASFQVAGSTSTGGDWLQVSPASGSVTPNSPSTLTVTATPGVIPPGTYSGTVKVTSPSTNTTLTIPVTMAISAVTQKILLSQAGLTFNAAAKGSQPLAQSFGILNVGQGSMSWSAKSSTLSGGSTWLVIDKTSGTVATASSDVSTVNVSVDPTGLAAGTYYGQVQVTAPLADSPKIVSVVLNVLAQGSNPGPEVQPTGLVFIGQAGSSPGSQNVMVSNAGNAPISFGSGKYTIPAGTDWLQYLPTNATVQPGQPTRIVVQPDYTNLKPGVIQGFLTLSFADGTTRTINILTVVSSGPGGASGSANEAAGSLGDRASGCPSKLVMVPTGLADQFSVLLKQPANLQVRVVDDCGNAVTTGKVQATFTNGDPTVALTHVGNGNWNATWVPTNPSTSQVTVTITAANVYVTNLLISQAVLNGTVRSGATAPLVAGVTNAASGVSSFIAPGGLVSVYGQQLADQTGQPDNVPFPTDINGTQILLGDKALPLRYVGAGLVNAQVPFELPVNTALQLVVQRNATLSVPQDLIVAAAQPAIYTQDQSGKGAGVIVDSNTGQLVTPIAPAARSDVLIIYCNGLGAVDPALPSGTAAPPLGPLSYTVNKVTVTIGGISAVVNFAGMAPGYPDLYQINAVLPDGVASGPAVPVVLGVAGQSSVPVTINVR